MEDSGRKNNSVMAFDYRDKIEYNRDIHHIRNYMDDDIILFRNPIVRYRVKRMRMKNDTFKEVNTEEDSKYPYYRDYPAAVVLCCMSNKKFKELNKKQVKKIENNELELDELKERSKQEECCKPKFYFGESGDPDKEISYKNKKYLSEIRTTLGEIDKQVDGCKNPVGRCAEQHAAKLLLDEHPRWGRKDVFFSTAFRPRTDEVIPYCANCKKLFF